MKNIYYIGIDPGKSGAYANVDGNGKFKWVSDFPLSNQELDLKLLADWFSYLKAGILKQGTAYFICTESVHSMPKQGVVSTFKFGKNFGILLGMIEANRIPYTLVTPQKWKKHFGLIGQPKSAAIEKVLEIYPEAKPFLKLKKHHNRADAILLATYLMETSK